MHADLLSALPQNGRLTLGPGAWLLAGFASKRADELVAEVHRIAEAAPFRFMTTRGGHTMSVAMTNCGDVGWVTDRAGYRYAATDPLSGLHWPAMPPLFRELAKQAAAAGGFPDFSPDACLINRYAPGARMSLHQDRDERDLDAPIVSVSLGLPATFLFGGRRRSDRPRRVLLRSGDVGVWGGPSRLAFHGIGPLPPGSDPLCGPYRFNLTFRTAL